MGGYEKSPDYGDPPPGPRAWIGTIVIVVLLAGLVYVWPR